MPDLFISYRRADAVGHARHLYDRLSAEFGAPALFLDRADIESGSEFPQVISAALDQARVLLALIGPDWLSATTASGGRRIDDPQDYVRREISAALDRGIRIIPVLFDDTPMPHAAQLPAPLQRLCDHDAHQQSGKQYQFDAQFEQLVALIAAAGVERAAPTHRLLLDLPQARIECGGPAGFAGQPTLTLNIPWRTPRDNVAALLEWRSRLTGLEGRDAELAELQAWADGDGVALKVITGGAGSGKTRLAFEFAERLRARGWQAGAWSHPQQAGVIAAGAAGVLLVLDYPEERHSALDGLWQALDQMPEPPLPLRILLLSRSEAFARGVAEQAAALTAPPLTLAPLPAPQSDSDETGAGWRLFQAAWRRLHEVRDLPPGTPALDAAAFAAWQAADPLHARPLFILAQALHRLERPDQPAATATEVIQHLVSHERLRLEREARAHGLHQQALSLPQALAAISGGLDAGRIEQLRAEPTLAERLPDYDSLRATSPWRRDPDGREQLPPLQPDLLAAGLLAQLLDRGDHCPGAWQYQALAVAADDQDASSRLGRLVHDAETLLGLRWPLQALVDWVDGDPGRSERLEPGLARQPLERPLLPLAITVGRTLADAAQGPAEQARLLNNLSTDLAGNGNHDGALAAIRRAVEIREELAQHNPAAYAPDLAQSLNNLSLCLADSGDRDGALATIRRAIEIREELAQQDPAAYAPDLAASLNNLSLCLADSGDHDDALAAIRRAVEVYEGLAQQDPAAWSPDLAMSLNNLSLRLTDSGNHDDALAASRRASKLYERLAQQNPAAYLPDLAQSLNNLSLRLADSGDHAGALAAIRRAVEVYEELTRQGPAAYAPDLGRSLMVLALRLREQDRPLQSDEALERAAGLLRPYAESGTPIADLLQTIEDLQTDPGD